MYHRTDRPRRGLWMPLLLSVLYRAVWVAMLFVVGCGIGYSQSTEKGFVYPAAYLSDVVDDYHGTEVADPYRWLEDPNSEETMAWVTAQNELAAAFLNTSARERIKEQLTTRWNYPRYSLLYKKGERYFFCKNDGLQNQSVWYMQKALDSEAVVILDPNAFSEDGTIAISSMAFSEDGTLLAYAVSESGSDWQTFRVRRVDTGEEFGETLNWCKFTGVAWKHDNSGFYYSRYPDSTTVAPEDRNNYNRVYWHALGTPQAEDKLVFEQSDNKELGFSPSITDDGKYLLLHVWHGTDRRNRVYYREVSSNDNFIRLLDQADAGYHFIDNGGSLFYFKTDLQAPRGRIIAIDITKPDRNEWQEIIPRQDDVLSFARVVNNQLVVAYMHDAHHVLKLYDLDGSFVREIELPTLGSLAGLSGKRDDTEMFVGFTSFLYPTSHFRYNFATGELALFRSSEISFDPSGYETRQVFYTSKDGTRVPMFITCKKGIVLDSNNPTILYGYGGFQGSMTPFFSIHYTVWMENGGVLAVACLRGGNEYGEVWHKAGMLGNKQNVFDDFCAAAEWLVKNKYTSPSRLAIKGASNGGLLVAACMVQRPELFGAVLCAVPVIDMLRYHKFTVGHYWAGEYGNAETNPEHFKYLYAYSPLHNIKKGVTYPPTLVTTADCDNRVFPAHAKKFVATLQAADSGRNPILLKVQTKAGHGRGKPTIKVIDELADSYALLFKLFDMKPVELH